MKDALISVYNKDGIVEFAKELEALGFRIIASPGTAKVLEDAGLFVISTAAMVGEAILEHRVVTLSRKFHAGLLAKSGHRDLLDDIGIPWIDLVCVDLYPLENEIAKPNATQESVLEQTDIGGVALLRSAAKGRRIVICNPADRMRVINWLKAGQPDRENFLAELAAKAEYTVSNYSLVSARYHGNYDGVLGKQIHECKYGENARQAPAGLFSAETNDPLALDKFKLLGGVPLSYNNWCDVDRLLQTITHIAAGFDVNFGQTPSIAVAVKHGNACGAATGHNPMITLAKMIDGDRRAIFGGVVITNFPIDKDAAQTLAAYSLDKGVKKRLLDAVIAPEFSDTAIRILKRPKGKCRFLVNTALEKLNRDSLDTAPRFRYVRGGFLRQPNYTFVLNFKDPLIKQHGEFLDWRKSELILAWAIGATSNSNCATLVRQYLIGNGVCQQDRVGACQLAITKAKDSGHDVKGAVAYTDSFFPFEDGPEVLAKAGVRTVLASSGSVRDEKIIKRCKELGLALWMIPDAIGRGFFGH